MFIKLSEGVEIKKTHLKLEEEEDIYSEEYREDLVEDDEISAIEAAFMQGYTRT